MNAIGIVFRILNAALMVGIPCLLAAILYRRGEGGFRPIWVGMAGFVLSQVGHIPFNQFLLLPGLRGLGVDPAAGAGSSLVWLGIAAGLSAGIFEEFTRYGVFRYWLKDEDSLTPLKYGVGHGGIEAILLGALALVALVQVLVLGGSEELLAALPADQADLAASQIAAYWEIPLGQTLLGAWERVSALLFHLGASLLVFKGIRQKRPLWLLVAVLGHAALDAFAVVAVRQMDFYLLEGLLFVFGLAWAGWAWQVRVRDSRPESHPASGLPEIDLKPPQVTLEKLEESRYE